MTYAIVIEPTDNGYGDPVPEPRTGVGSVEVSVP